MTDNFNTLCNNSNLRAVQIIVAQAEDARQNQGKQTRTKVECVQDTESGEYLKITRTIVVNADDSVHISFALKVDDVIECQASFSGGAGFSLSANDIEQYHAQITRLNQLASITQSAYGWIISVDPHSDKYLEFPPTEDIPLYLYRKETLPLDGSFDSAFLRAMRDLDAAWLFVFNELESIEDTSEDNLDEDYGE